MQKNVAPRAICTVGAGGGTERWHWMARRGPGRADEKVKIIERMNRARPLQGSMSTNDPPFILPIPKTEAVLPFRSPPAQASQVIERVAYDMRFTDELIRRCRARAAQGYRLATTLPSTDKREIVLVFEAIEWNGTRFPPRPLGTPPEPAA